jgi:hypothetical protein
MSETTHFARSTLAKTAPSEKVAGHRDEKAYRRPAQHAENEIAHFAAAIDEADEQAQNQKGARGEADPYVVERTGMP